MFSLSSWCLENLEKLFWGKTNGTGHVHVDEAVGPCGKLQNKKNLLNRIIYTTKVQFSINLTCFYINAKGFFFGTKFASLYGFLCNPNLVIQMVPFHAFN